MRTAQATRRIGWVASLVALIGLPFAWACGGADPRAGIADAGAGGDGAPSLFDDGGPLGLVDGSVVFDGAVPGFRTETDTDEASCADFVDDFDGDGADCADSDCHRTHICCVESTSADCCSAPTTVSPSLDFRAVPSTCTDSTPAAMCVGGVIGFGAASATFVTNIDAAGSSCADGTGAMAPQGGARSDAGLLFNQTYDTGSAAVAIEAHVGVGSAAVGSIDAIAVGLTAQTDLTSASARVRPLAAIVVSATDQTLRAVAGDVMFDPYPLATLFGAGGCHELDVRLVTSPDGTFDALFRRHGDAAWTTLESGLPFRAEPLSHPIVYGRTTNPGTEGVHAWVRSVGVGAQVCDVLAPSRTTDTVLTTSATGASVRSVTRLGGLAAYEMDGTIYSAGVDGNGHISQTAMLLDPSEGTGTFFERGVFDPELAQVGANVRLYFTGLSAEGVRSIGYLDYAADLGARVVGSTPRQLFEPANAGALDADGPAYLEATELLSGGGTTTRRLLVFRARVLDGGLTHTEIRALELNGPTAVLGVPSETVDISADATTTGFYSRSSPFAPDEALYQNRSGDESAFDRDEVSSPEVVLYNDVFRIFFAGRRGARWSIGVLRSPDFEHFDLASTTPVLSGSGAGFDAVSVSDPDVFVAGEQLSLYYSGADGVETRPGLATQMIPL